MASCPKEYAASCGYQALIAERPCPRFPATSRLPCTCQRRFSAAGGAKANDETKAVRTPGSKCARHPNTYRAPVVGASGPRCWP